MSSSESADGKDRLLRLLRRRAEGFDRVSQMEPIPPSLPQEDIEVVQPNASCIPQHLLRRAAEPFGNVVDAIQKTSFIIALGEELQERRGDSESTRDDEMPAGFDCENAFIAGMMTRSGDLISDSSANLEYVNELVQKPVGPYLDNADNHLENDGRIEDRPTTVVANSDMSPKVPGQHHDDGWIDPSNADSSTQLPKEGQASPVIASSAEVFDAIVEEANEHDGHVVKACAELPEANDDGTQVAPVSFRQESDETQEQGRGDAPVADDHRQPGDEARGSSTGVVEHGRQDGPKVQKHAKRLPSKDKPEQSDKSRRKALDPMSRAAEQGSAVVTDEPSQPGKETRAHEGQTRSKAKKTTGKHSAAKTRADSAAVDGQTEKQDKEVHDQAVANSKKQSRQDGAKAEAVVNGAETAGEGIAEMPKKVKDAGGQNAAKKIVAKGDEHGKSQAKEKTKAKAKAKAKTKASPKKEEKEEDMARSQSSEAAVVPGRRMRRASITGGDLAMGMQMSMQPMEGLRPPEDSQHIAHMAPWPAPRNLAEPARNSLFQREPTESDDEYSEVMLHIYDLHKMTKMFALPFYHLGVEVYDAEICFGVEGLVWCPPGGMGGHVHKKVLPLGRTNLSLLQVHQLVAKMGKEWPGSAYKLLTHNCQTFAVVFCELLGLEADCIPADCRRFANTGKRQSKATETPDPFRRIRTA